jgi:uroporphyrinogen decarboxylase-like protein
MLMYDDRFLAVMGKRSKKIPHFEYWSCPDAESYLTGTDYFEHPQQCRLKLKELYPELDLPIPQTDEPIIRPGEIKDDDEQHKKTVRWGDGQSWSWEHGETYFKTTEDVFAFSPLEEADFTDMPGVIMNYDFSSEEVIYQRFRADYPKEWGDMSPEGSFSVAGFYNTMFMWPLLTFGWELFLECCLDSRFERIMDEFSEINRRVFRAIARLPVNFVSCHDDIVNARGAVCSPSWMHRYIFPYYEEFWSILKGTGKEVIFVSDGCLDCYVDDIVLCGARAIVTEPYTDFKAIARKHPNICLAGEGDNRILMENEPTQIRQMVESMVETARMTAGYMICVGNHIPWNIPPEAIKLYLELSRELAHD